MQRTARVRAGETCFVALSRNNDWYPLHCGELVAETRAARLRARMWPSGRAPGNLLGCSLPRCRGWHVKIAGLIVLYGVFLTMVEWFGVLFPFALCIRRKC